MTTKKTILIITIFFTAFLTTKAQIYFNNSYNEPVWVALGYPVNSKEYKGWVTTGWFKVEPGEKKSILNVNPTGQYIYYYAQTKAAAKKFEGGTNLLCNPSDAFTIKNADKEYVKKDNTKYQWYKFRQIDKGIKDVVKLKYTIDFKY